LKIDTSIYKIIMKFKLKRFWPPILRFEIFGLIDYNKILYLESDTLVKSNIYELFNRKENLLFITNYKYLIENMEIWDKNFNKKEQK